MIAAPSRTTDHHNAVGIHFRQPNADPEVVVISVVFDKEGEIDEGEDCAEHPGFNGDLE